MSTLPFPCNAAIGNDLTHALSAIPYFGLSCGNERYTLVGGSGITARRPIRVAVENTSYIERQNLTIRMMNPAASR
jgi:hypothetical protein